MRDKEPSDMLLDGEFPGTRIGEDEKKLYRANGTRRISSMPMLIAEGGLHHTVSASGEDGMPMMEVGFLQRLGSVFSHSRPDLASDSSKRTMSASRAAHADDVTKENPHFGLNSRACPQQLPSSAWRKELR